MSIQKYYAVANGRRPGIYEDWKSCSAQTEGYSKALFKSFTSKEAAQAFIDEHRGSGGTNGLVRSSYSASAQHSPYSSSSPSYSTYRYSDSYDDRYSGGSSYSVPPNSVPIGGGRSVSISSNSAPQTATEASHAPSSSTSTSTKETVVAWTDGACSRNGQRGSSAGVGVWFGYNDPRNISEPLTGTKQTNQRAELLAGLRAMEAVDDDVPLDIMSDSAYLVNGMNSWLTGWQTKYGTHTWQGVENEDLFRSLADKQRLRTAPTNFIHVPAHSGIEGNEEADRLAVGGIRRR